MNDLSRGETVLLIVLIWTTWIIFHWAGKNNLLGYMSDTISDFGKQLSESTGKTEEVKITKNEKDGLIELIKQSGIICDNCPEYDCSWWAEHCADHLIANGVIVPPCKVGDTVWLLQKRCKYAGDENKPWDSCGQYWDNVCKKGMWGCAGKDDAGNPFPCEKKELVWYAKEMEYSFALYSPNIVQGENLFLTREEAEQALKERE